MAVVEKVKNYLVESYQEMKKVSWPTRQETTNYSLLIIGVSLVLAAALGLIDYFLSLGVQKIFIR